MTGREQPEEQDEALAIPLRRLLKFANPVRTPPWADAEDLRRSHVATAMKGNRPTGCSGGSAAHAIRIADLCRSGWTAPILIDVGAPSLGCRPSWIIMDGNHRVYAAAMLGDLEIRARISGDVRISARMFRIKCA